MNRQKLWERKSSKVVGLLDSVIPKGPFQLGILCEYNSVCLWKGKRTPTTFTVIDVA